MAILVNTDYCDELLVENLIFVTGASVSPCVYIQSPSRFPQCLWMTCLISCLDRKVFMTGAYVALPFLFVSPVVVIYTRRFVIHCCIVFAVILGLCFFVHGNGLANCNCAVVAPWMDVAATCTFTFPACTIWCIARLSFLVFSIQSSLVSRSRAVVQLPARFSF